MNTKEHKMELLCAIIAGKENTKYHKPNNDGDYVFFTDSFIGMWVPKTIVGQANKAEFTVQNMQKLLSIPSVLITESYTTAQFKNAIKDVPKEYNWDIKYAPCGTCNETGEEECDLGHGHECRKCGGEGRTILSKEKKQGFYYNKTHCIQIRADYFDINRIHHMILALETLEQTNESILLTNFAHHKGLIFKAGEVKIIIMPITEPYQTIIKIDE